MDFSTSHFSPRNPYPYKSQFTENIRHSITKTTLLMVLLKNKISLSVVRIAGETDPKQICGKIQRPVSYKEPMTTALLGFRPSVESGPEFMRTDRVFAIGYGEKSEPSVVVLRFTVLFFCLTEHLQHWDTLVPVFLLGD
jgi:hypothetical protein